jgi:DNA repair exonuclease SbcCD ATPase subunit
VNVEFLQPLRFLSWARDVEVAVPPGLSLFLGDNGAGKTALALEAPSWCVWKKTIRGTKPDGEVHGTFEAGGKRWRIERTDATVILAEDAVMPGKGRVWVNRSGQTPTETQERIDRIFGSWRRFSSTRVFSRRLLNRFGGATDKERKALLEEVLGYDRFERAYQWALKERGRRDEAYRKAHAAAMAAYAAYDQAQKALEAMHAQPGDLPADVQAQQVEKSARRDELHQKWAALTSDLAKARAVVQGYRDLETKVRTEDRGVASQIAALTPKGAAPTSCPTCKRPFGTASTEDAQAAYGAHVEAELATLRQRREVLGRRLAGAVAEAELAVREVTRIQGLHDGHGQALSLLDRELAGLAARFTAARERSALLTALETQHAKADAENTEAQAAAVRANDALAVAEHACAILGPKGVRVKMLAGGLALLEVGANEVLPRLGGQVSAVRIAGSRTKADGDAVAEVSIKVEGAGGGEYRGTSDGEMGRVDAALLLGLARISGDPGFICFDEPFDGLDKEGLAGVCEILQEMAQTRQVVVITHSDDLVSMFPAAAKFRCSREGDGPSVLEAA